MYRNRLQVIVTLLKAYNRVTLIHYGRMFSGSVASTRNNLILPSTRLLVPKPAVFALPVSSNSNYSRGYSSKEGHKYEVTIDELKALINSSDIQLIDVREPSELTEVGYIPKSINIPLGTLKEALKMDGESFQEKYHLDKPALYESHMMVFYGLGPIKSKAALDLAHKYGYAKARHYPGGYEEWITKAAKK